MGRRSPTGAGPRGSDLGAEGNVQVDAGGVERVVAAVGGGGIPQPRHNAQRYETEVVHAAAQLADGGHRLGQVGAGDTAHAFWVGGDELCDLVVADQMASRSGPRGGQSDRDAASVHVRDGHLEGERLMQAGKSVHRRSESNMASFT